MIGVERKPVLKEEDFEEEPHIILQNLTRAEVTLMGEKKKLETKMTKLKLEIKNQIQNKMNNIKKSNRGGKIIKCDDLGITVKGYSIPKLKVGWYSLTSKIVKTEDSE